MSKNLIIAIVLTVLAVLSLAPFLVLAYGTVLGHSYSSAQMNAGVGLAIVGGFVTLFASYAWSDL